MGACPCVCLRVDVQCSMASFCWLMIPQPPLSKSGSEVGTKKQNSVFAPATPLQSGCPWQHPGGLCQFWATSVQGLLWVQKNVKGGDLETFPQLRKNGCPPNALPRSLSCSLFQHREEAEKCNEQHFAYLLPLVVQTVITPPCSGSVTAQHCPVTSNITLWASFVVLSSSSTRCTQIWSRL